MKTRPSLARGSERPVRAVLAGHLAALNLDAPVCQTSPRGLPPRWWRRWNRGVCGLGPPGADRRVPWTVGLVSDRNCFSWFRRPDVRFP